MEDRTLNKKIFLYIRDSLGNEIAMKKQEQELREFAKQEFEDCIISTYRDKGSVLEERKGLNRLLEDVVTEKPSWVIVSHLDRFYKITYENGEKKLDEIVEKILQNEAGVISLKQYICYKSYKELERIRDKEQKRINGDNEIGEEEVEE